MEEIVELHASPPPRFVVRTWAKHLVVVCPAHRRPIHLYTYIFKYISTHINIYMNTHLHKLIFTYLCISILKNNILSLLWEGSLIYLLVVLQTSKRAVMRKAAVHPASLSAATAAATAIHETSYMTCMGKVRKSWRVHGAPGSSRSCGRRGHHHPWSYTQFIHIF